MDCARTNGWIEKSSPRQEPASLTLTRIAKPGTMSLPIELPTCDLRPWRRSDRKSLLRCANNWEVARQLRDRFPHPYTADDADEWLSMACDEDPATNLAIVVDGDAVGGIGLELQSDVFGRSAEIGYWLAEAHWGRGIMSEAVPAVTRYALDQFDLCRLFARVFECNPASARVLEKAGYTLEGRMRRSVVKDGRMLDQLLYAYVLDEDEDPFSGEG